MESTDEENTEKEENAEKNSDKKTKRKRKLIKVCIYVNSFDMTHYFGSMYRLTVMLKTRRRNWYISNVMS